MAKTKIAKDSLEFYEIKVKYETGKFTFQQLAEQYGVTDRTIKRFAESGKWKRDVEGVKALYDATKLVHQKKILSQFKKEEEKHADIVLSNMAKEEGEKIALLTMQSETFKQQIEHQYAKAMMSLLQNFNTTQELTKSGKVTDTEFEYLGKVVDKESGKEVLGTVVRKTTTLRIKDYPDLVKIGQGLGFLQTPQQQQNTQINIGTQQTKDIINIDSQEIKQGIDKLHDNLVKSIETE